VVHADERWQLRRLERLVPELDHRRRELGRTVNISDVTSGASYKTANGFLEPYGDYGETAVTSTGKTIAIWGEGNSYTGPGGVWVNRQT
jgi:hypothetical protein